MTENLSTDELKSLIKSVFSVTENDQKLAILIDIPDEIVTDNPNWRARRNMAQTWQIALDQVKNELGLNAVELILYPNVHSNNADLPTTAYWFDGDLDHLNVSHLQKYGSPISFKEIFDSYQLFIALTELSATAPLKLNAREYLFRAVTMPGFSNEMIPSLRLDYNRINDHIMAIKNLLDPATGLEIIFKLPDDTTHQIYFDLRFRTAHASSGRFPTPGTAGNLPGGECYIVPYEGEKNESSQSSGILPVQFEDEIVLYQIEQNKAIRILTSGKYSTIESKKIAEESAYANIAEIGFGILRSFGVKPIGEILLDEKLGLHIAFGRSDHFGGAVGIKDFKKPENVIHIDRIYIPETQPDISPEKVEFTLEDGRKLLLMEKGVYTIFS